MKTTNYEMTGSYTFSPSEIQLRDQWWGDVRQQLHERYGSSQLQDQYKVSDLDLFSRFCLAKSFREKYAKDTLLKYAQWRREERVDEIVHEADEFPSCLSTMTMGICGKDKKGYPIYYDFPEADKIVPILATLPLQQCLRWHTATVESLRGLQYKVGAQRFTAVVDVSQVTLGFAMNRHLLMAFREASSASGDFYPENFDDLYVVNSPRTVSIMWSLVSHFLDERVRNKVHFVTREEANEALGLTEDEIPEEFGGTLKNGLMKVPQCLRKLAKEPKDMPFGYGKDDTLLPEIVPCQQNQQISLTPSASTAGATLSFTPERVTSSLTALAMATLVSGFIGGSSPKAADFLSFQGAAALS